MQKTWGWTDEECTQRVPGLSDARSICIGIDPNKSKTILLLGDSHAQHLIPGMRARWQDANLVTLVFPGCKIIQDWESNKGKCLTLIDYVFNNIDFWDNVDSVVISMRQNASIAEGARSTIKFLQSKGLKDIVYVGPIYEFEGSFAEILSQNIDATISELDQIAKKSIRDYVKGEASEIAEGIPGDVTYINTYDLLCPRDECLIFTKDGIPVLFDANHYTVAGSKTFVRMWPDLF